MSKQPKPSQPTRGEGPSPHKGTNQHGWSPDVDETTQQDNPSAHRSFHPDEYAPAKGPGRKVSKEEAGNPHGKPVKSHGTRGEDQSKGSEETGMHDTGPRGRSQRPSGTKDASAATGVDPQDPPGKRSGG
ncbi:hypothetical protein [Streptomyces antarcticus]|uniref:hypothetical protein n=1 Tax=Streptomyces antarcticus TaxID=2996458 RepID=UPI00226F2D81|nr:MULTISPECIES: hypothetical protein [unclassified Streptomyces]MCY0946087.1 hypothetical protein [Streptomyces sp. H34-AA3]MCZ4081079.1 hypothetical protein [Streptomyces sp. H34-S5]